MDGLCPVCGNLASAHKHYGARVCQSCKGFFRRCVLKGADEKAPIFRCQCGNCKSCKYEKCLLVGMRPTWVEAETSRVKKLLPRLAVPRRPKNLTEKFTRDEYMLLQTLFDSFCNIMDQEFIFLYKKSPFIFSEFWSGTLGGRSLTYNTVKALEHVNRKGSLHSIHTLMGKESNSMSVVCGQLISCIDHNISSEDIRILLSHNIPLVASLKYAMRTNAKNHLMSQYLRQHFWRQFETSSKVDHEVHNLRVLFEENLGVNGSQSSGNFISNCASDLSSNTYLTYNLIFDSPWACSLELEDRHRSITGKIHTWINDSIPERSTVEEIIIVHMLLELMSVFSSDFVDGIREPTRIQRQQQAFCHLMYKFLKARHGAAKAWIKFGGAAIISSYARELQDIEKKRLHM